MIIYMSRDKSGAVRKEELPALLKEITSVYARNLQEAVITPLSDRKLDHVKNIIKSFVPDE